MKTPVELDLVVLSVFELGFGDQASHNDIKLGAAVEVSLHDIYARAIALGFDLCPAKVGPALRLNYLDQPLGEFLPDAISNSSSHMKTAVNPLRTATSPTAISWPAWAHHERSSRSWFSAVWPLSSVDTRA
jgi:hypothetical protein